MHFYKHAVWLLAVLYLGIIETETAETYRKSCDSDFSSELKKMHIEIDNLKGSNLKLEEDMSKLKTELRESRKIAERGNAFGIFIFMPPTSKKLRGGGILVRH